MVQRKVGAAGLEPTTYGLKGFSGKIAVRVFDRTLFSNFTSLYRLSYAPI